MEIENQDINRLQTIGYEILKKLPNFISDITHIIVQGDTATTYYAAVTGFQMKKKVIHIEAGLRTYDLQRPFPEEGYRQMISRIADVNYTPHQDSAYILEEASKNRRVILIATGSEVSIALKARELLEDKGIGTRVVSMPCMELFSQQDETYKRRILPAGQAIRIGIEAGVRTGWDEWLLGNRARANKSSFVGMKSFGASAPAEVLFNHFGITPDRIASEATNLL